MPVDANKLRRVRRNLGSPPTDGSPEIEVSAVGTPSQNRTEPVEWPEPLSPPMPVKPEPQDADTPTATRDYVPQRTEPSAANVRHSGVQEGAAPTSRYRIPPREGEPRIPFTTRIAASTKERLEDACYHLRTKHQAFIDEAIRRHLEKHGF